MARKGMITKGLRSIDDPLPQAILGGWVSKRKSFLQPLKQRIGRAGLFVIFDSTIGKE